MSIREKTPLGLMLAVLALPSFSHADDAGDLPQVTVHGTPYGSEDITSATKTRTPLHDIPQSIVVVSQEQIQDQALLSIGDVVRYLPGITAHQGENNRDQIIMRGNSSSADFFLNGVRDDVQYYRDLYNIARIEALKGPNAMIFGRGGGGGVINRVSKEAMFSPLRTLSVMGGSYDERRIAADVNQPVSDSLAFRVNGVFEDSNSFRDFVDLQRYAVNPTLTTTLDAQTKLTLGYEFLHDTRTADRGVPSFQGRPVDIDRSTYFGDPDASHVRANTQLGSASIEHSFGALTLRNRILFGDYDRFYQNFVPGAVTPNLTQVTLTAYNNATLRRNIFNQTDFTYDTTLGATRHTLLAGAELGRQQSDNFRNTGFFNDTSTSFLAPFAAPTIDVPVTFRQSATDADNRVIAKVAAAYVQDQVELNRHVQVLAGVRFDRFDLDYRNNRNGDDLSRVDNLWSPRAGLVYKPIDPLSVYASYGISYLPSSGDQFSSLTSVTETLEPEKFDNYEVGAKWDVSNLSLTAAAYRLERTNTRSTDPNDPTRIVQTGAQRTDGVELGISGSLTANWSIAGGYAWQDAKIVRATAAAPVGARVAQVPRNNFSLWNHYRFAPKLAAGLGMIYRSQMFAAIDDTVTLPGYTRVDAALYYELSERMRLQVNIENLFDRRYIINADGNNNISFGASRLVRVGLTAAF